jgi:hypothetical protein
MSAARHLLTAAAASHRALRWVSARAPFRLAVFATLSLVASWHLLATAGSLNTFRDAQVLAHYESAAVESILRYAELPLWDPWYCGGMYLLGSPQARFVSPTLGLSLLFGESRGEALAAFALLIVGLEGTFRYARARGASRLGAMVAAPVFALSGIFAIAPWLGWINFFSFELLPWAAYGTRLSLGGDRKAAVVAAGALALSVGFGGTYTAPMAALLCAFEVADRVTASQRRFRPAQWAQWAQAVALVTVLSLGLAAVRLWPILDVLHASRRIIGGTPGNSFFRLAGMALRYPTKDTENGTFFIGALALPAALLGLTRRGAYRLGLAVVLCVWLAAGYAVRPSLFGALRALPVYSTLRYPERFLILAALGTSALAAQGITVAERLARRQRWRLGPISPQVVGWLAPALIVTLVVAVGPLVLQHWIDAGRRDLVAQPSREATRPFHQARGNRWLLRYYAPIDRGSLSCWDAYAVPESARLRGDLTSEAYLDDASAGTVAERSWSPNRLDFDVSLARPARLLVNQNWNAGWRASEGAVVSDGGLLAVDLPEGQHLVSLRFEPRSAKGGLAVSLVSLAAAGALLALSRRRLDRGASLFAVILAPPLALAVCGAVIHEPPTPPPEALTPLGEPVIADGVPPAAIRIDARFGAGVHLEAATLSDASPPAGGITWLELDWRRTDTEAKGLGVFMHIKPETGSTLNGDHVLLSSSLDFDDAPPEKTLRDVIPISVPADAAGKTYKIWVGLWKVRSGGARIPIEDPGGVEVDRGRLLAGAFTVR